VIWGDSRGKERRGSDPELWGGRGDKLIYLEKKAQTPTTTGARDRIIQGNGSRKVRGERDSSGYVSNVRGGVRSMIGTEVSGNLQHRRRGLMG